MNKNENKNEKENNKIRTNNRESENCVNFIPFDLNKYYPNSQFVHPIVVDKLKSFCRMKCFVIESIIIDYISLEHAPLSRHSFQNNRVLWLAFI